MYSGGMTDAELRRLRKRLGLTQKELAAKAGVTSTSVARWERGDVRITEPMSRLLRLLAASAPQQRRSR